MRQIDRMTCEWEPMPWDASDAIVDEQLAGFYQRSAKPICWEPVRAMAPDDMVFGKSKQWLAQRDIAYYAEHDGERLLLIQLSWHGFPDPPEWGLASRLIGHDDKRWSEWGYFAYLPAAWSVPQPATPYSASS